MQSVGVVLISVTQAFRSSGINHSSLRRTASERHPSSHRMDHVGDAVALG